MNIVKIVDKVDKEDKLVENWTQGRWIPIDSVKSWNYFENYGHKIGGMGCIDSEISPTRCIWLVHIVKYRVGIILVKWGVTWISIKIENIVVISHITQEMSNTNKKQTNKQTNKKKI